MRNVGCPADVWAEARAKEAASRLAGKRPEGNGRLADSQGMRTGRNSDVSRPLHADGHGNARTERAGLVAPDLSLKSASVLDDDAREAHRNAMAITGHFWKRMEVEYDDDMKRKALDRIA